MGNTANCRLWCILFVHRTIYNLFENLDTSHCIMQHLSIYSLIVNLGLNKGIVELALARYSWMVSVSRGIESGLKWAYKCFKLVSVCSVELEPTIASSPIPV